MNRLQITDYRLQKFVVLSFMLLGILGFSMGVISAETTFFDNPDEFFIMDQYVPPTPVVTPSGGGGGGIVYRPECVEDVDCELGHFCMDGKCYLYECETDADCNDTKTCWMNMCVKLFDMKIIEVSSPIYPGEFFNFTYFIKGVAAIHGDVIVDFWLVKDGRVVTEGFDTIYMADFEERTESTELFLPKDFEAGVYNFYAEVSYDSYYARAGRLIEVVLPEEVVEEIPEEPVSRRGIFTGEVISDVGETIGKNLRWILVCIFILLILVILFFKRKTIYRQFRKIKKGFFKFWKKFFKIFLGIKAKFNRWNKERIANNKKRKDELKKIKMEDELLEKKNEFVRGKELAKEEKIKIKEEKREERDRLLSEKRKKKMRIKKRESMFRKMKLLKGKVNKFFSNFFVMLKKKREEIKEGISIRKKKRMKEKKIEMERKRVEEKNKILIEKKNRELEIKKREERVRQIRVAREKVNKYFSDFFVMLKSKNDEIKKNISKRKKRRIEERKKIKILKRKRELRKAEVKKKRDFKEKELKRQKILRDKERERQIEFKKLEEKREEQKLLREKRIKDAEVDLKLSKLKKIDEQVHRMQEQEKSRKSISPKWFLNIFKTKRKTKRKNSFRSFFRGIFVENEVGPNEMEARRVQRLNKMRSQSDEYN